MYPRPPAFALLLAGWAAGCQRDDILVAADERAAGPEAHAAPDEAAPLGSTGTGAPTPGVPDAGAPGVPGAVTPGIPGAVTPGSPDPVTPGSPGAVTPGVPGPVSPGVPAAVTPGAPGAVTPGVAAQPVPGVPVPGAAGVPSAPAKGVPEAPKPAPPGTPQPNSGPQTTISGIVKFTGYKQGSVRVTVFDGDHSKPSASPPRVLGMAEIKSPGAFSLTVPEGSGKVYIEGSIDEDLDGRPGPQEPQGKADRYPLTVASTAIANVEVTLQRVAPPPGGGEKQDDF